MPPLESQTLFGNCLSGGKNSKSQAPNSKETPIFKFKKALFAFSS
jgi:hypothetical protein